MVYTIAIIKCNYSTDNFKVGDPARVDPSKKPNQNEIRIK